MKLGPIISVSVIVLAMAFGAIAFKSSLVAFLPFDQAVRAASTGSTVQIMGTPVPSKTSFDQDTRSLHFTLREQKTNATMDVVFKSPKPDNFDEAVSIQAYGKYDPVSQTFLADKLLVKCPSKYAGDKSNLQNRSYGAQS